LFARFLLDVVHFCSMLLIFSSFLLGFCSFLLGFRSFFARFSPVFRCFPPVIGVFFSWTPPQVLAGSRDCVKLLLAHGANPHQMDGATLTPLGAATVPGIVAMLEAVDHEREDNIREA
jgi:hypothetical protein